MPVEIRELHIKATIVDKHDGISPASNTDSERFRREIIKACVKEVLQILEDKRER